jgi:O-methyltransferase
MHICCRTSSTIGTRRTVCQFWEIAGPQMHSGARLLVVEMVLPGPNQPSPARRVDLLMLVAQPGRERTEAEYRDLLAAAGFCLTRVVPT